MSATALLMMLSSVCAFLGPLGGEPPTRRRGSSARDDWIHGAEAIATTEIERSPESVRLDLYNIRPARWLDAPYRDFEVPRAVVRSFTGVGQTLRRIGDHPEATRVSEMLWTAAIDPSARIKPMTVSEVMTDTLDPIDVEDVVLLYLQNHGWVLIPSSRMHDTPMYEAALRRSGTATWP